MGLKREAAHGWPAAVITHRVARQSEEAMASEDVEAKSLLSKMQPSEGYRPSPLERRGSQSLIHGMEMGHLAPTITLVILFMYFLICITRGDFSAAHERGLSLSIRHQAASSNAQSRTANGSATAGKQEGVNVAQKKEEPERAETKLLETSDGTGSNRDGLSRQGGKAALEGQGKEGALVGTGRPGGPQSEGMEFEEAGGTAERQGRDGEWTNGKARIGSGSEENRGLGGGGAATCQGVKKHQWPGVDGLEGLAAVEALLSKERGALGVSSSARLAGPNSLGRCAMVGSHASTARENMGAAIDSHDVVVRLGRAQPGEHASLGWKTSLRFVLKAHAAAAHAKGRGTQVPGHLDQSSLQQGEDGRQPLRLLVSKEAGKFLTRPSRSAIFEQLGAVFGPAPRDADRQVLHIGDHLAWTASQVLGGFYQRLQCAFEDRGPPQNFHHIGQSYEWEILYTLLRSCDGGVTAYGLSGGEAVSADERLAHEDYLRGIGGGDVTEFVKEVLMKELKDKGLLRVCNKEDAFDCGVDQAEHASI